MILSRTKASHQEVQDHQVKNFNSYSIVSAKGLFFAGGISHNVRRYVQLAQNRGGASFCTRGAMKGYPVISLFSRWQKP
jgi:hypothetical protein